MQANWYILTIPANDWNPPSECPTGIDYIKGQKEIGESGYEHWQLVAHYNKKVRLRGAKTAWPNTSHLEPTRSERALEYVWKEETRVEGTQFEIGRKPINKKKIADWDEVWEHAKKGKIEEIPADIRIRNYSVLRRIEKDYMKPPDNLEAVCGIWYYGIPGAGKSHKARERYPDAYLKPCNKWWDGYQNEENVLIDDLDKNHKVLGHHLKIWADRYAFIGESKGTSVAIRPKNIVVTSNYSIDEIFGEDQMLCKALKRRFKCTEFLFEYHPRNIDVEIINFDECC